MLVNMQAVLMLNMAELCHHTIFVLRLGPRSCASQPGAGVVLKCHKLLTV